MEINEINEYNNKTDQLSLIDRLLLNRFSVTLELKQGVSFP